jgi:hypothetical protein
LLELPQVGSGDLILLDEDDRVALELLRGTEDDGNTGNEEEERKNMMSGMKHLIVHRRLFQQ